MDREEILKYACVWWAFLWALCFGAGSAVAGGIVYAGGLGILYWWGSMFHKPNKSANASNTQGDQILPLPTP